MSRKGWIPPSDLLAQVKGIEKGLTQGRNLRKASNLGLVVAAIQFIVVATKSDLWAWVTESGRLSTSEQAITGVSLAAAAFGVLFWVRTGTWLTESKQPFRYTCSIGSFDSVRPPAADVGPLRDDLRYDLAEKLNERIGRLSFLDEALIAADPEREDRSHIHIRGHFLVRTPSDKRMVEVTPRVRIGGKSSPETLAHSIKFELEIGTEQPPNQNREARPVTGIPEPPKESGQSPAAVEKEYARILEWVYFSVATQIYKQLRDDVEKKIRMLPTRYLRATAYLHEADDYAQSNTLDAYDEAQVFYGRAMELFDPALRILPTPWFRKPFARCHQMVSTSFVYPIGRMVAYFWPRAARRQVLAARAQIGYASSLINRRILAGMSGHRMNPVYEANPLLKRTIRRLQRIPSEVPDRRETLFDAHATEALLWHYLGSTERTQNALGDARRLFPSACDESAAYLLAAGLAEVSPRQGIPLLRLAVEQDPRSEIAQFELAEKSEMIWRTRLELEHTTAKLVLEEYDKVLRINPGNVRAWASFGYIHWLLRDFDGARQAFLRGRDYKSIRPGTYVAEIDLGLARANAELGKFDEAYRYYGSGTSAHIAKGADHERETSAQYYFFDFIGPAMLRRFETYRRKVSLELKLAETEDNAASQRIRDSVAAFVLNDYGEACRDYYSRTGEKEQLDRARESFLIAAEKHPRYVMPYFNLHLLDMYDMDRCTEEQEARALSKKAIAHVEMAKQLEPTWPDALLAIANAYALRAQQVLDVEVRSRTQKETKDAAGERLEVAEQGGEKKATLETLVPHEWMWNRRKHTLAHDYKWRAVRRRDYRRQRKWERELDDLQVKALFAWNLSQLLMRVDGDDSGGPSRTLKHPFLPVRLRGLLRHIRDCYWPADWSVLWACRTILGDKNVKDDLLDCARRRLLEDPAGYGALEFVHRQFFVRGESSTFRLFSEFDLDEQQQIVNQGLAQQFVPEASRQLLEVWRKEVDEERSRVEERPGQRPRVIHLDEPLTPGRV